MTKSKAASKNHKSENSEGAWKLIGRVATGGTAFAISGESSAQVFLASPAGLFKGADAEWSLVARGFPFLQTSATLVANGTVFAAGLPEGLVRSYDGGETWQRCWAEQIKSPITCLVASPRLAHDGVLFAGTQSDGVLRSLDGGKHWALSNFGLRNFNVLALTVPPMWERREVMFVGTENGVYRSPNGGRAWKLAGLEGQIVQALAVSPNFAEDQTVFAGTESKGLYRSTDSGATWQRVKSFSAEAVNALCYFEKVLLAGANDDYIYRSNDGGETWTHSAKTSSALCLARVGDELYAGVEAGVLHSTDGKKWSPLPIAAHRFDWFVMPSPKLFVAAGVTSGVWTSVDGNHWKPTAKWEGEAPLLNIAASTEVLLAATPNQLMRSIDLGATWDVVLDQSITALTFSDDKTVWAGGEAGVLWHSADRGRNWQMLTTPFDARPITGVAAVGAETLIVCTADQPTRRVFFYRSHDGGKHWRLLLDEASVWFAPRFSEGVLGLGTVLLQLKADGWVRHEVTDEEAPLNTVLALEQVAVFGTAAGLFSLERNKVKPFAEALAGMPIVGLQAVQQKLYALTADGKLYLGG